MSRPEKQRRPENRKVELLAFDLVESVSPVCRDRQKVLRQPVEKIRSYETRTTRALHVLLSSSQVLIPARRSSRIPLRHKLQMLREAMTPKPGGAGGRASSDLRR